MILTKLFLMEFYNVNPYWSTFIHLTNSGCQRPWKTVDLFIIHYQFNRQLWNSCVQNTEIIFLLTDLIMVKSDKWIIRFLLFNYPRNIKLKRIWACLCKCVNVPCKLHASQSTSFNVQLAYFCIKYARYSAVK